MRQRFWDDDPPEPPHCDACGGKMTEREDPCGVDYVCAQCGHVEHHEDPRIAAAQWERGR